ncbi:MAG: SDR family oxidoreductase [Phycisphaerae bacterium]|nr:SDR family oxidoreductase [Phycisphaerae bacterium]
MPTNIAIIGCGYVGSALGKHLAAAGHDVLATTRSRDRLPDLSALGLRPAVLDVVDVAAMRSLLADRHAVFLTVAAGAYDADYRAVYLRAAQSLAEVLPDAPVRRLIYTSSTSVYAQNDASWVDEDSPAEGAREGGKVLVEAEKVLLGIPAARPANRPLSVSVVRLTGIYGPSRDHLARIHSAAGATRDDGNAYVNMVHRDDIITALVALLDTDHHGVLNLSGDRPMLRREYYDRLLAAAGLPPVTWTDGNTSPRGKRVRNDRIKLLLGLTLRHPQH